jgi:hypothetical protein
MMRSLYILTRLLSPTFKYLAIRHLQYAQHTSNTWLPLTFLQLGFLYISVSIALPSSLCLFGSLTHSMAHSEDVLAGQKIPEELYRQTTAG